MRKPLRRAEHNARARRVSGVHLTEDELIRSLDGELSSSETVDVDNHLLSCWSCRRQLQAIEDGIRDLVDYQNLAVSPYLPPSLEQRAVFVARLNSLASRMERPWRITKFLTDPLQMFAGHPMNRVAQIAGVLVLIASSLVAYLVRTTATVSADELLSLASASETKTLATTREPIIVQKLHIAIGNESLTRTIYRDVVHDRSTSTTDTSGSEEKNAKAAYSKSSLGWNSPLDAETYRRFRAEYPKRKEEVVRCGANELTLKTEFSSGPIAETDLTVRTTDYHAIEERIRLDDHSQIEIAELSYDVIPLATLPVDVFGPPSTPALPQASIAPALRVLTPSNAELASAVVDAERVLHGLGADLGEQISIDTHADHKVLIQGVVADDARKQQLISALHGIAATELRIVTIDEAAQLSSAPSAGPVRPSPFSLQVLVAAPPLLDAELNTRFPDKDQRIAYVNQTLSLAQLASARAWALNRLADHHPIQGVAVLDDDARRQLQTLLTDHVSALREDIGSLQNQLAEILSGSSNTPAANTSISAPMKFNSSDTTRFSEDWRDRIRRIHSSTETVHEAVATLITSAQPSDHNDAETIEVNLRTSLTQLQTELQVFDQEIRKTNLR